MSTKPTPTATGLRTDRPTMNTREAPQTFDPFNTNPTPQMFADKWRGTEE